MTCKTLCFAWGVGTRTKTGEVPYPAGTYRLKEELRLRGTNMSARLGQSLDGEFRRPPF